MSHLLNGFAQPALQETVVPFGSLDAPAQELLIAAFAVRQRAYAPYSNFKVGAAFRATSTNIIFPGCNVENAAFSPTSCAERSALTRAVSDGYREFSSGAVVAYEPDVFTSPCGVCRQFIREFAGHTDMPLYIAQGLDERSADQPFTSDDPVFCTSIFNLLPNSFKTYCK
ncbi:CG8353 [Drosophila busckii]|uniref:Cytidine deaminase n=1 Tax=Drosophila busckii TaxID=30019 RepID=A0A0M3QT31_DROBS|nr:cytidine deaminase [Drosophila busckii]ALC38203.1 CG8353 [Drosophila busckii]